MTKIFIQFLTIINKLLLQKMIYKLFINNEKIDIFTYFVLYNKNSIKTIKLLLMYNNIYLYYI